MPTIDSKQLAALLRAAAASDELVTEVAVPGGGLLRYRRQVSLSVSAQIETVSADGQSIVFQRVFRAAAARPSDYPSAVSFLANHEANLTESPDGFVLAWEHVSDLDGALDRLVESSIADGWLEDPKGGVQQGSFMGMRTRAFRRGGRQRVLSAMPWPAAILSCIESSRTREPAVAPR